MQHAVCVNTLGAFVCGCAANYTRVNSTAPTGAANFTCAGINPCAAAGACDPLTICAYVSPNARNCSACPAGFTGTGTTKCVDVNECLLGSPCSAHALCVNTNGSFACAGCDAGYARLNFSGANSAGRANFSCVPVNPCASASACDPLTSCAYVGPGACSCSACPPGFGGSGLAGCSDINECTTSAPCDPAVACTNTVGGYRCGQCPSPPFVAGAGYGACVPLPAIVTAGAPGNASLAANRSIDICGSVVDATTGAGIPGALVYLLFADPDCFGGGGGGGSGISWTSGAWFVGGGWTWQWWGWALGRRARQVASFSLAPTGAVLRSCTTDAAGRFNLSGLVLNASQATCAILRTSIDATDARTSRWPWAVQALGSINGAGLWLMLSELWWALTRDWFEWPYASSPVNVGSLIVSVLANHSALSASALCNVTLPIVPRWSWWTSAVYTSALLNADNTQWRIVLSWTTGGQALNTVDGATTLDLQTLFSLSPSASVTNRTCEVGFYQPACAGAQLVLQNTRGADCRRGGGTATLLVSVPTSVSYLVFVTLGSESAGATVDALRTIQGSIVTVAVFVGQQTTPTLQITASGVDCNGTLMTQGHRYWSAACLDGRVGVVGGARGVDSYSTSKPPALFGGCPP